MRLLHEWRTGEEIQEAPMLVPPNCVVVLTHWRALSTLLANSSPGVVDKVRTEAPPEADQESDDGSAEAKSEVVESVSPVHSPLVQIDEGEPILDVLTKEVTKAIVPRTVRSGVPISPVYRFQPMSL